MSGDPGARRQEASRYVRALFGRVPERSLVELRFRVPAGMAQRFVLASRQRDVVDAMLSLVVRTEVFVGVLPRARPGGRCADVVDRASVLWADCDNPASVAALSRFEPKASMVVGSGSRRHLHAYWFLQEPIGLDRLEPLNRRLAAALGADDGVVTKSHTILRPAGSVNRKHSPPAPVRLVGVQPGHRVSAEEIDAQLPQASPEQASTSRARSPRASSLIASSDPLRSVLPPVYFERLTGLRVGPSGKLRCLFHDDRSPSLRVYDDPQRGWYFTKCSLLEGPDRTVAHSLCFGCGRGGSIYRKSIDTPAAFAELRLVEPASRVLLRCDQGRQAALARGASTRDEEVVSTNRLVAVRAGAHGLCRPLGERLVSGRERVLAFAQTRMDVNRSPFAAS